MLLDYLSYVLFPLSAKYRPQTQKKTCKLSYNITSRRLSGWLTQIIPVVMEQIVIPENLVSISPNSGIKEIETSLAANKPPTNNPIPAPVSP